MKKYIKQFYMLFLLVIFSLIIVPVNIYAQTNNLEYYQIVAFDGVTRISLTFSERPVTNIKKEANSMRLTINIPNCGLINMPDNFDTPDPLVRNLNIAKQNNNLIIEIITDIVFEQIKQSGSRSQKYIVHIDMIKSTQNNDFQAILGLIDYNNYLGNQENVRSLLNIASQNFPDDVKVSSRVNNRFPTPKMYIPKTVVSVAPVKTQTPPAPKKTQRPTASQTSTQKPKTTDKPVVAPAPKQEVKPLVQTPKQINEIKEVVPLPSQTPKKITDLKDISYTIITDKDRFPSRIPMTKIIEIERDLPILTQGTPKSVVSIQQEPLSQKEIPEVITNTVIEYAFDTGLLSNEENQLLKYYNVALSDSIAAEFMLGVSAGIVGDYTAALELLKSIPEESVFYQEATQTIYKIYMELGDLQNAALYSTYINRPAPIEDFNFINTPVKLWLLFLISFVTLVIGYFVSEFLNMKRQSSKETITEDDLSRHQEHLKRAYENKELFSEEKNLEFDEEKTVILSEEDEYENPPLITDDLNEEEEQELLDDESSSIKIVSPNDNDFDTEDEMDSFGDDEYKKKMVLKLYNDGWNLEEIAKELQMSQREIDFIVKMNQ